MLWFSLALPAFLWAAGCEDSFTKQGNPFSGTKYNASVSVPDLNVPDAMAQLRGIAVEKKLDILTEDVPNGSMLLEYRESFRNKPIPYVVSVAEEGKGVAVSILVKLNKGAIAKADDAKTEMCSILNAVKGGEAGRLATQKGSAAGGDVAPRQVDAYRWSMELARHTQESAESVPLRNRGKAFTVSGKVDYVRKDGDVYRVAFDIPERSEAVFRLPNDPSFKIDISCLMAPKHAAWSVALRPGEKIKLTGVYSDFDSIRKVIWLEGCKPE
jgi:hypothetical protein